MSQPTAPQHPSSHSLGFETHRLIIDGRICGLALAPLSQALGKGRDGGEVGVSNPRKGPQAVPVPRFWLLSSTTANFTPPLDLKSQ